MHPSHFDGFALCDVTHAERKHGHITLALPRFAQHPWHTSANDATVILVPALIDYITHKYFGCQSGAGHSEANYLANIVQNINNFGHYPAKRHVLITGSWTSASFRVALQEQMPRLIFAIMEETGDGTGKLAEGSPVNCTFGLGYVTNYATYAPARFGAGSGRKLDHPALIPTKRPQKFKLFC